MSEAEGEEQVPVTAGERLRAAREAAKLSLEDVATTTRIPTRHLASLEAGEFSRLPAPTYSIGFARSYAAAVGLDRNEIGEQVRAEIGGTRLAPHQAEQFEPMDPKRVMPRWLIIAAIAAIAVVALLATWLNNRSMNAPDNVTATEAAPVDTPAAAPAAAAVPVAAQSVSITATGDTWVQIKDGASLLKEGVMKAGEKFDIPPTATAPKLTTGKAESLTISVGPKTVAQVGPSATKVRDVSLLPSDLLRGPAVAAAPAPRPAPPPAARPVEVKKPAAAPAAAAINIAEPAPLPSNRN